MIDLHCHLLPALDDGPRDISETVEMARQAAADGIDVIVATPHIRDDHNVEIGELESLVALANGALDHEDIPVRIAQGGEIAAERIESLSADELRQVSLGVGGSWLLVEPRPGPIDDHLVELVKRLHHRRFHVLVAHPERHAGADFLERVRELVDLGALMQATASHVAEGPASPTLLRMAEDGLIHAIASDSHSPTFGRPVMISHAVERLAEIDALRPHIDWITTHGPAAMLRGEHIRPPFEAVAP
jgi:protein-tyrosine phosphatase